MDKAKENGMLERFIVWREKHISQNHFILILSLVVGVLSAMAAFALKHLIHFIQHLLTGGFDAQTFNWLYLVYPQCGFDIINWSLSEKPHSIRQHLYRLQNNMQKCHYLVTWLYISKDYPVFVVTELRMSSSGNGKVPVLGAR